MKATFPMSCLCAAVLITPLAGVAGDLPETVMMVTPDQFEWTDNPRVPGLGLARMIAIEKEIYEPVDLLKQIELTRMPLPAHSRAALIVMPRTPDLAAP